MKLNGLISATYTPFNPDSGDLNLGLIAAMTDFMVESGSSGFYVCGSTGEGESMSVEERKLVAESYVRATKGRVPVIVQVGHNSIASAKDLAAHASEIGADAISTLPPIYFKPASPDALVDYIAKVAAEAPELPYYYYHIPRLTGVSFDMLSLLGLAQSRIPSFAGVKFSDFDLSVMMACQEFDGGKFDIPFGSDEMLLGALACGATGAVGSCYGFAAPLWLNIINAFEAGRLEESQQWMRKAARLVRFIATEPGPFQSTVKQVIWPLVGFEPGPTRAPQVMLNQGQIDQARRWLDDSGFGEEIAMGVFRL